MTNIQYNFIKFGLILFAVSLISVISSAQAHAANWLSVDAHYVGNAYLNGFWDSNGPTKVPASPSILLHGNANFDGGTTFYVDCDNDGNYEQTIGGRYNNGFQLNNSQRAVEWFNGYQYDRHSWNTPPWGENNYYYDAQTSCNFTTPGVKTVGLKATRGGLEATGSLSSQWAFQERVFTFQVEFPSNGDYKPPINDQNSGAINPGTSAPANIDLIIGMREQDVRYQNDTYAGYDSRPFSYTVDCDEDGQFDDYSGSSNNGANGKRPFPGIFPPTWTGGTFADNICRITAPGRHMVNLKIIDPNGGPHTASKEVFVISSEPFKISVYPVGQAEGDTKYYLQEPQSVGISFKITGLTPINTGSYNTTINCGNGQPTISGPGANGRNYPDGTLIAENGGTCSYSPGTYTVKVSFQENKPASEALQPKSGQGTVTMVVLGDIDGIRSVVWPFELKWQVNDATSCSIVGGAGTNFSATGLGISGTKPVSKVTVRTDPYEYKLTCTGANASSDRTIKVKVVDVLE